jgi:class 3 adenylate cyclase
VIACTTCGTDNESGRKFCIQCGNRLAVPCPACSTVNPLDARFCGQCGTALTAAGTAPEAVRRADEDRETEPPGGQGRLPAIIAERRLVSVVFVDLVGFTTASEVRDAEDTRELLTRYYETAQEIMARHGGTIEKFIGDAVMAVWGTPTAHEDDAERAVRSAIELVNAVARLASVDGPLQARAGVLTGEAAVSIGAAGQGMVAGDLVNTASRLQSAAAPGTVLVGEATYRAASRAIEFEDAGARELKGKAGEVHVWRAVSVVALRGGEGRAVILEPPFVGRDDDLQLLKDLFHATAREGKPRLVTVSGLAGIGKSRLLWELEKYLDGVIEGVFWQVGRSPSYGEGISYWALAEMIRGRAGISDADDADSVRQKVATTLERFLKDEAERRWIEARILGLLGLDELPSESREELFAAWRTLFERIAAESPVVLVFLDLQWADQGTLDFVEHVLTWARTSPIMVLAEARPELFDRRPTWGRSVRSATLIHLEPLAKPEMERLLTGLVPDLPLDALRRIVERAEGVPLYAVETLRMLIDRGILRTAGRQYEVAGAVPELAVPETLHALIAARLDALSPEQRGLMTDASILGVSFSLSALVGVSKLPAGEVTEQVEHLTRRELLILDADPRSPERGQYRFIQGVVREVAYQSLAKRDRQAKHVAAARFFEGLGDDEIAGVLATHYLAAYRAAHTGPEADALAAQARVALRAAADRATSLHDLLGALAYVEDALTITTDPAEQALLHERAVPLAGEAAHFQRAYQHGGEARRLFGQTGDRIAILRTAAAEASVQLAEHRDQTTIEMLQADLAAAADLPPSPEVASAQVELARAMMLAGNDDAVTWCDRVLAQPAVATPPVLLEAIITKGTALQRLGRVVESEALLRGATVIADAQGNLVASMRARNNLRVMLQDVDLPDSLVVLREVYDLARRFGQRTWLLHSVAATLDVGFRLGTWDAYLDEARAELEEAEGYYRQWLHAEEARRRTYLGDPVAAERSFDEVLAAPSIVESAQATSWNLAGKADALTAQGRFDEAFAIAETSWNKSAEVDTGFQAALFAAVADGRADRVTRLISRWRDLDTGQLPLQRAFDFMSLSLLALIERRWDDARIASVAAEQQMEGTGADLLGARFRLAFGHLGANRFPEAVRAAQAAEAFFSERNAMAYVERYRSAAFVHAEQDPSSASPSERSPSVRAGG